MDKSPARAMREKCSSGCALIFSCIALLFTAKAGGQTQPAGDLYRQFRNPPASYSLMPYWYWNGRITPSETRRQIQEMIAQGVHQAIFFPWDGMQPAYLSEEYWKAVGAAFDIASELKFTLNFADEYDWPSGHAWDFSSQKPELSRVLQEHPEYRMHRLDPREHTINGPAVWRPEGQSKAEFIVAARQRSDGRIDAETVTLVSGGEFRAPDGQWLVTAYYLVPAVGGHNTRVDLLNADAVKAYIGLVYEEYLRRFPQHLGTTVKMTVADHEGSYGLPIAYTPRLWQEFQSRKGYDLRPLLPLLSHDSADDRRGRKVRSDYLDVISDLYTNSFTRQVADWCRRHNLLHGTSLYEEQLYIQAGQAGDMYRHWRAGSVVQIDALLERARMPVDFKEAVSVAHLDNKPLVVENQGLQGHATYFSLEKARLGTNMALLWGANLLVPYFDYDPQKITWPPQWFLGQPFWPYFHHYADYVRRAQFMNAQGAHVARIALYYPLETAFANSQTLLSTKPHPDLVWNNSMDQTQNIYSALQLELARQGWDYHVLDSDFLRRAEVHGNVLRLADEEFRVLLLPPMTDMAPASIEKIRQFIAAGGTVIALGTLPEALPETGIRRFPLRAHPRFMDRLDYMKQIEVPEAVREDLRPALDALRSIEPPETDVEGGDRRHLFASHRRANGVDWFWVVNDSSDEQKTTWRFPGTGALQMWNAETGERTPLCEQNGRVPLHFSPWDAYFVVRTSGASEACSDRGREGEVLSDLSGVNWQFTPEAATVEVPYANVAGRSEPVWLHPERNSNGKWWLAGPFPYNDHNGFFEEWPPEKGFDPKAGWTWYESPGYTVTLRDALPNGRSQGIYYAYVNVYSPQARSAKMVCAFADSMQAWINGERKLFVHRHPKWSLLRDPWAEMRDVKLRKGWNTVLLKIGPSLMVPTAFLFRLTDGNGATLTDLIYARDQQLPQTENTRVRLTVRVPPGAIAVAGANEWTIETDAQHIPEHPIAFHTGTVPFRLASWTDSALAHYSGSARYETEFRLATLPEGKRIVLDLGAVGVAAEVWVNGAKCGERVWRPFEVDITNAVKPGPNRLMIRVANSDAGRQAQGDTIYPKGSWGLKYKTELDRLPTIRPNGLEGPVRVIAR
jgi:hypothetical protein